MAGRENVNACLSSFSFAEVSLRDFRKRISPVCVLKYLEYLPFF